MSKPWGTQQWKKRRLEFLDGRTCDWCGSTENLAIHHNQHFEGLKEYKKLVTKVIGQYFAANKNQDEELRLLAEANQKVQPKYLHICPKCELQVYARKTISPKYKCKYCSTETDRPTRKLNPESQRTTLKEFRKLFLHSHKDIVDKAFKELKGTRIKII
jgi:hypothetical protein